MPRTPADRDLFKTVLGVIAVFDLGVAFLTLLFWLGVARVADPYVCLTLMAIRIGVWVTQLWRMLAPVRPWQARPSEVDDPQLLAADEALQALEWRFTGVYTLGWLLSMSASAAFGLLGIPRALEVGDAELATAGVMLISLTASALICHELLRALLGPSLDEVSRQIHARGLTVRRRRNSIAFGMQVTIAGIVTACVPGLVMLMGYVHILGLRAEASLEQQRRAELAVLTLAPDAPLPEGMRIVMADELPPVLRELGNAEQLHRDDVVLRSFVREDGEAVAAVARGDGSYLLARAPVDEPIGLLLLGVLLFSLVGGSLGVLIGSSLWRSQRELLRSLDAAILRVAAHGDIHGLTRLVPLRNDEIGQVARNFNDMLDMLDELALAVAAVARGDLRVQLDGPGDLHAAFRGMLEQLSVVVAQLSETAIDVATTAREILAATQEQEAAGEQQTRSFAAVSETLRSLADAASEISIEAAGALGNAEQTLDATDAMSEEIAQLNRHASGISKLLEQIREIADRSDMLALNGALEATRVGENGRGFALVADEMRRLAERVTGLVGDVRDRVADIEASSTSSTTVTTRSRTLASDTAAAAREIASVIRRQSEETEQVSRAVSDVTGAATAAAAAVTQTRAAAQGLHVQAERLEQLLGHFAIPVSASASLSGAPIPGSAAVPHGAAGPRGAAGMSR